MQVGKHWIHLTFLHSGSLGGRVTQRGLVVDVSGGGRRWGLGSPPVHLARLYHPSHLALGFWRAVLSAEAINIQHVWERNKGFTTKAAAGEATTDSCSTVSTTSTPSSQPQLPPNYNKNC